MANGIYIAMSGAIAAQKRLDVVANNVANVNTPGFRQQRAQFSSFLVPTGDARPVEKGFAAMTEVRVDDTPGPISTTGNPLDVAIDGPGYFVVGTTNGPLLTRAGNFRVDADGTLVDAGGNPVLSGPELNGSPIRLRPDGGRPSVGSDGSVSQDGTIVAQLSVVRVNATALQPVGNSYFSPEPNSVQPAPDARLSSGALEGSNMNPVRGLVELVTLTQEYQTNNRVMNEYRKLDQKIASSSR